MSPSYPSLHFSLSLHLLMSHYSFTPQTVVRPPLGRQLSLEYQVEARPTISKEVKELFSLLACCADSSSGMKANHQKGGIQFRCCSSLPKPMSKVCDVFRNILP